MAIRSKVLLATTVIAGFSGSAWLGRVLIAENRRDEAASVLEVEERFRVAKLKNDVAALELLVADDYKGLNQNGNARDKAAMIALFAGFRTRSLSLSDLDVRVVGDAALVSGTQIEHVCKPDRTRFVRTYHRHRGRWRLLASTQVRELNQASPGTTNQVPEGPLSLAVQPEQDLVCTQATGPDSFP